ncbi:glucosyltransferase domain-containing protein [Pseudomonas bijieensis]|uniref:Glucosyl transferase GtrII n=1 Tax=Pseudomonas bijieensis TaxID=2681983 RepID=A0A6N1CKD1_9PSED|nr:glucosyltransferase domain-containing protein [Pseudomonas bijieensis]QKS84890.1 hypothetical protein GN234_24395 [Pseudomonas bijieensis]
MMNFLSTKVLSKRDVLLFFLAANFLYIFPLVQADYFYHDDGWRALVAGEGWREEGRVVTGFFYNALSFGTKAPDLFPLPLFIATASIAFAMRALAFFYFERPAYVHCLVVLPIWYNPFFLQNLSYRYDGPAMALGLVAIIHAVIWRRDSTWQSVWVPALLVALALSIYQVLIGFYIALCCVEVIRRLWEEEPSNQIFVFIARKLLAVLIGVLIYYATSHQLMTASRQSLLPWEPSSLLEVRDRWLVLVQMLNGWMTEGIRPLVWGGTLLALAGYAWGGVRLFNRAEPRGWKISSAVSYVLTVPVLFICIPGITVLFADFIYGTRTLVAFSAVLVLVFFLGLKVLTRIYSHLGVILLIPLLAILSFSFGHGRTLSLQKEQEAALLASLVYDITHSPLRDMQRIYMIPEFRADWLPAASGMFAAMPAQRDVLGVGYVLLPEALPRAGITNVYLAKDQEVIDSLRRGDYSPIISTRFYDLFVIHDIGYILIKKPKGDPDVVPTRCLITNLERCR